MRMHAQTAMIENGFVHLPERAPWLAQYLHELTTFPNVAAGRMRLRSRVRNRLSAGGKWIRTIGTWKISYASFSAFGCVTYLMSP